MGKKIKIDVTELIKKLEEKRIPFYPVMMYILLKATGAKEDEIYFEQSRTLCLKTTFDTDFEVFFKNYVFDCFKGKHNLKIKDEKLFFALKENQRADFVLYPFENKDGKIILTVWIRQNVSADFEKNCAKICADF